MAFTINASGKKVRRCIFVYTYKFIHTYVPQYKTYAIRLNYLSETRKPSNRNGVYDLHIQEIVCQQDFACEYNTNVCVIIIIIIIFKPYTYTSYRSAHIALGGCWRRRQNDNVIIYYFISCDFSPHASPI